MKAIYGSGEKGIFKELRNTQDRIGSIHLISFWANLSYIVIT